MFGEPVVPMLEAPPTPVVLVIPKPMVEVPVTPLIPTTVEPVTELVKVPPVVAPLVPMLELGPLFLPGVRPPQAPNNAAANPTIQSNRQLPPMTTRGF